MGKALFLLLVLLLFTFLLAPVILVIPMSFSADRVLAWPPVGFSLRWYAAMFSEPGLMQAARNSLILGLIVTAVSVLLATPAALVLARSHVNHSWGMPCVNRSRSSRSISSTFTLPPSVRTPSTGS